MKESTPTIVTYIYVTAVWSFSCVELLKNNGEAIHVSLLCSP